MLRCALALLFWGLLAPHLSAKPGFFPTLAKFNDEKLKAAVVQIRWRNVGPLGGSGFFVAPNTFVLNRHVVQGVLTLTPDETKNEKVLASIIEAKRPFPITHYSEKHRRFIAYASPLTLLQCHAEFDLCIARIANAMEHRIVDFSKIATFPDGNASIRHVMAGFPILLHNGPSPDRDEECYYDNPMVKGMHCQKYHLSEGKKISHIENFSFSDASYPFAWQSDIDGVPGSSGSPVVTTKGVLIGMHFASNNTAEAYKGRSILMPAAFIRDFVAEVLATPEAYGL